MSLITDDTISYEITRLGQLGYTVSDAIDQIKRRVNLSFGPVNCRMTVLCHPIRLDYLFDYFTPNIVSNLIFPLNTVFILCDNVCGKQIIHLADTKEEGHIDWSVYAYEMVLHAAGISDALPGLIIDIPALQAIVKIVDGI